MAIGQIAYRFVRTSEGARPQSHPADFARLIRAVMNTATCVASPNTLPDNSNQSDFLFLATPPPLCKRAAAYSSPESASRKPPGTRMRPPTRFTWE
jgi:hypothetical protein